MSTYDKASLVLIPSGTKEGVVFSQKPTNGDGDFTFSRSTAATRVNADGLIEKETQNLLLQSNSFDTTWFFINGSGTLTSGQSGYDGSSDAWLLSKAAASVALRQNVTLNGVQTFSVYASAGSLNWLALESSGSYGYFDLVNGVAGTDTFLDTKFESIGGGWWRISATDNASNTRWIVYPADGNNDLSGTSGNIYIQDAQLEEGLVARDYIETTTTAVYGGITDNVPRLDYTDSSCPALLLEPQRTNKLPYSEYFEDAGFGSNAITLEGGYLAPDGTNSAYKITATNSSLAYLAYASIALADDARSIYARSVSGTGTAQLLSHNSNTNNTFTLTEQWQRFELNSTPLIAQNFYPVDFRGGGTLTELIIWGAQVEEGSYATSYIPTYGTSLTKLSDSFSIQDLQSKGIFGASAGTIFLDIKSAKSEDNNEIVWQWNDSLSNPLLRLYYREEGQCSIFRFYNNLDAEFLTDNVDLTNTPKIAISYDGTSRLELFGNGTKLTKTGGNFNSNAIIDIFSEVAADRNSTEFNRILFFPTALSDDECIALTQV